MKIFRWTSTVSARASPTRFCRTEKSTIAPARSWPELRHEIGALRSRITRTLESLMRKSEEAIQDELVTIRNDRFVIPVKSDHRARVNGVAHGYSSSGATAFVEPLETIEANNELQALHEAEAREIWKILAGLTEELRAQLPALEAAAEAVAQLDFINAKAAFDEKFNCVIPEIGESDKLKLVEQVNSFELVEARHPLLEENLRASGGSVVPVTFALDDKARRDGDLRRKRRRQNCSSKNRRPACVDGSVRSFSSRAKQRAFRFTVLCSRTLATINRSQPISRRSLRTSATSRE